MAGTPGNTATMTFTTAGMTARIKSMSWTGLTVTDIEVVNSTTLGIASQAAKEMGSDLSAKVVKKFYPGSIDFGTINVTGGFDPADRLPMSGATESITCNFPLDDSGDTTNAKIVFVGYVNSVSINGMGIDEETTVDFSIKVTTEPTFSDQAA